MTEVGEGWVGSKLNGDGGRVAFAWWCSAAYGGGLGATRPTLPFVVQQGFGPQGNRILVRASRSYSMTWMVGGGLAGLDSLPISMSYCTARIVRRRAASYNSPW